MRRNFGSGDKRILVSVGLLAVVGMMPLFSGDILRLPLELASVSSGGFNRRTSSRSNCRIRKPRVPSQPLGNCEVFGVEMATPTDDRPYNSMDVTPTIVIHRRSLSSLPNSEAREYIMEDMGSE
jgi:hypothetical protein